MENTNTIVGKTHTDVFSEGNLSRAALGGGAILIGGASAYMNVAGWVAQAADTTGAIVNGVLATGMELSAAGALAWAAYQTGRSRPLRAAFAAAAGGVLIYFNTLAAQNFIHLQHDQGKAGASAAALTVADVAAEIATKEREIAAIERRYGSEPPRSVAVLDAASLGLQPARRRDAATLRKLAEEKAQRAAYDAAQGDIARLRGEKRESRVTAAGETRTVMPADHVIPFIWAMELLKGSIFFMLGGSDLGAVFRRRAVPEAQRTEAPPSPKQSPAERAKWARVKGGNRKGGPLPV